MERVEDVESYSPDVEAPAAQTPAPEGLEKLLGGLELDGVTFGYSRLAPPLIENFSLSLRPGGSVAFVGASGWRQINTGQVDFRIVSALERGDPL